MGRSSSIGSPLLNIIRTGVFLSSQEASPSTIPPKEFLFLNETSPRALREAMTHQSVSAVTVSVYPSLATRAGYLARTTFSTTDSKGQSRAVTEYWWSLAYHHSRLAELCGQRVRPEMFHHPREALSFRVWTLPGIIPQGRKVRPVLLSAGLPVDPSHA